jgi:hypothetical protein
LTSVDFPQAIPPVNPIILIFLSFLPIKNMNKQGIKVVNKGSISVKKYLAIQN